MDFTQAIVTGEPTALNMAKTLLQNPMLVSLTPPWAISLEVETDDEAGEAEVSRFPVIVPGKGTKSYISDNIAPMPMSWKLTGYIPGNPLIERRNIFTPIVQLNTDFLRLAFKRGSRLIYKDMDQHLHTNCVISALSISHRPDCQNKRPFTMTLNEIVTISASDSFLSETEENAKVDGAVDNLGQTSTNAVSGEQLSTLGKLARGAGLW